MLEVEVVGELMTALNEIICRGVNSQETFDAVVGAGVVPCLNCYDFFWWVELAWEGSVAKDRQLEVAQIAPCQNRLSVAAEPALFRLLLCKRAFGLKRFRGVSRRQTVSCPSAYQRRLAKVLIQEAVSLLLPESPHGPERADVILMIFSCEFPTWDFGLHVELIGQRFLRPLKVTVLLRGRIVRMHAVAAQPEINPFLDVNLGLDWHILQSFIAKNCLDFHDYKISWVFNRKPLSRKISLICLEASSWSAWRCKVDGLRTESFLLAVQFLIRLSSELLIGQLSKSQRPFHNDFLRKVRLNSINLLAALLLKA